MAKKPKRKTRRKSKRAAPRLDETQPVNQPMEYKSLVKTLDVGAPYDSTLAVLNAEALDGWDLVSVCITQGILNNVWVEVFYLKRLAAQVPSSDSPPA